MSQRSPYNDRYKVDQKGKTRKSASAAKPKRDVADLTPGGSSRKAAKKSTAWSRAKAASASSSRGSGPALENSPRMKELRRYWWWAWGAALVLAIAILGLQQLGANAGNAAQTAALASHVTSATAQAAAAKAAAPYNGVVPYGWGLWVLAMAAAFYLEFGPIRKERAAMVTAAREGKSSKSERS